MAGAPEPALPAEAKTEPVEKAYTLGAAPAATDVCVQVVPQGARPGALAMPWDWAWAFFFGAADWNTTDVNMRYAAFGDPTCAQKIEIIFTGIDPKFRAYTEPLSGNGLPTDTIKVNPNFYGVTCNPFVPKGGTYDLPWSEKVRTATHELGHALGFMHPQLAATFLRSAIDHVPGTATVSSTTNEALTYNYASVMHAPTTEMRANEEAPCVGDYNGNVTQGLSADDRAAANARF